MDAESRAENARVARIEQAGRTPVRLAVMARSELVRLGLKRLAHDAGMQVVGDAGDMAGLAALRHAAMDVVIVESGPSRAALDGLRAFIRSVPEAVVVLIDGGDERSLLEALAAGARGCVAADAPPQEIVAATNAAARGEIYVSRALARRLTRTFGLSRATSADLTPPLTARERDVLALIARGWDNAQIGQALHLSTATVKRHIASMFAKLGVENRVQAAVRAVVDGLLDPED